MGLRSKSKERSSSRKVTPPSPSYMSSEQFASYLAELRESRMKRPGGARPLPQADSRRETGRASVASHQASLGSVPPGRPSFASTTRTSMGTAPLPEAEAASMLHRTQSEVPKPNPRPSAAPSITSRYSTMTGRGRDYYPDRPVAPLKPGEVVPTATYIERGQRWMEKEEAFSLRHAMEDMDLKNGPPANEEEERIYQAALDEAAELVWRHEHGVKPPEPGTPYAYKPHLRKNSYAFARTASAGFYGEDVEPTGLARDLGSRSVSGSSTSSDGLGTRQSRLSYASLAVDGEGRRSVDQAGRKSLDQAGDGPAPAVRSRPAKAYSGLKNPAGAARPGRRRSSMKRSISGEVERPFSGDQIFEESEGSVASAKSSSPEKSDASQPLRSKPRNPLNRVQLPPDTPASADTPPPPPPKMHKYEIHRNPPTQSRNAQYTTNTPTPPPEREDVPKKHGVELRSDEIRQATSMRLKDRSPKLPTPTAVSDSLGRPIVSFDKRWKAPEEATDDEPDRARQGDRLGASRGRQDHQAPPVPAIAATEARRQTPSSPSRTAPPPPSIQVDAPGGAPPVPTIAVSDGTPPLPTIVVPDDPGNGPDIPVIVTPDDGSSGAPAGRPLPTPQKGRPAVRPRGHWSPAPPGPVGPRATARCHECSYPIEGRFIALAGGTERFHPQCFRCYTCGTALEALEISPEPDHFRAARLDRIRRRAAGEALEEKPGETMAEDGDERLRFYCHLDWHELFAPRCKHCTTPILGEHVVALGHHWHYGHFFCAECGDPFEKGMTHIEKDGYAWCVNCQTRRTERRAPKCRKCRAAVIGQYVRALGGEWHDECFRCATCGGGFDDGQVFPREGAPGSGETVVLCTGCRARELKS